MLRFHAQHEPKPELSARGPSQVRDRVRRHTDRGQDVRDRTFWRDFSLVPSLSRCEAVSWMDLMSAS